MDEVVYHIQQLPRFVQFNFPDYEFKPEKIEDLGNHYIKGQLQNQYFPELYASFEIQLIVYNSAPELQSKIPNFIVPINSVQFYNLSEAVDKEGQKI